MYDVIDLISQVRIDVEVKIEQLSQKVETPKCLEPKLLKDF